MVDVREVIAAAIPCNIVFGRPQAADGIISALHTAGFRILGPDEVDQVSVERCAEIAKEQANEEDGAEGFLACKTLEDALRALASGESR